MSDALIVELARNAMLMALALAGPMLLVALGIGLLVSLFQAVTQIQEQTLAFVPKLIAVAVVFLVGLPWMTQMAIRYTTELLHRLPSFAP
jgi:flagellar biosynthetic protein FliQ